MKAAVRFAACAGGGLLLYASFAPAESAESAWIALVPLMAVSAFSAPVRSFGLGWVGGMFFWLPSLAWLLKLADTGGVARPVIGLGWVALAAYCSLYIGAFSALSSAVFRRLRLGARPGGLSFLRCLAAMLALSTIWTGLEYLRSSLFTGFAWNQLGCSQYRLVPIIQMAEFGGVYAVSWLIVFINAALLLTGLRLAGRRSDGRQFQFHAELAVGVLVLSLCFALGQLRRQGLWREWAGGERVRVGVVQPAIPQNEKWSVEREMSIYSKISDLTELSALLEPDLIVWPETALPAPLNDDTNAYVFVSGLAGKLGICLLAGALEYRNTAGKDFFYNSSFLFDREGSESGRYRKQHLVMLGEYMPFEERCPWIGVFSPLGYSCSAGTEATVFLPPPGKSGRGIPAFSALICFEDTVAALARRARLAGARFLVVQTNDAWFDGTAAPAQHLAHSVLRAVENRIPVVRCANSGVSGAIAADGSMELLRAGELIHGFAGFQAFEFTAAPADAMPSFYSAWGDWTLARPSAAFALLVFLLVVRDARRENRGDGNDPSKAEKEPAQDGRG